MPDNFWQAVKESKYGDFLKEWWKGKYDFLAAWVNGLRSKHILGSLMLKPFHFVFNGAGFRNELNTRWEDGFQIPEVILYAPLLRREILSYELVIDLDVSDKEKLIKRAKWVKATLETLEIDYTLGFSGRRGFHFHIIVDPSTELPPELPPGFNGRAFKEALLRIIATIAGSDGIDFGSSGVHGRHAIREFFSINEKTLCFKLPVSDVELVEVTWPEYPKQAEEWQGYRIWQPSHEQLSMIFEEIERMSQEQERNSLYEALWKARPRKRRTIGSRWRIERIQKYAEALIKYGSLTRDPEIASRHQNEHMARLHLLLLMLDESWSDEEIHSVFRYAEDYKAERTQYFIDYNRRRLNYANQIKS